MGKGEDGVVGGGGRGKKRTEWRRKVEIKGEGFVEEGNRLGEFGGIKGKQGQGQGHGGLRDNRV